MTFKTQVEQRLIDTRAKPEFTKSVEHARQRFI